VILRGLFSASTPNHILGTHNTQLGLSVGARRVLSCRHGLKGEVKEIGHSADPLLYDHYHIKQERRERRRARMSLSLAFMWKLIGTNHSTC
jgi:hypothetical protein